MSLARGPRYAGSSQGKSLPTARSGWRRLKTGRAFPRKFRATEEQEPLGIFWRFCGRGWTDLHQPRRSKRCVKMEAAPGMRGLPSATCSDRPPARQHTANRCWPNRYGMRPRWVEFTSAICLASIHAAADPSPVGARSLAEAAPGLPSCQAGICAPERCHAILWFHPMVLDRSCDYD